MTMISNGLPNVTSTPTVDAIPAVDESGAGASASSSTRSAAPTQAIDWRKSAVDPMDPTDPLNYLTSKDRMLIYSTTGEVVPTPPHDGSNKSVSMLAWQIGVDRLTGHLWPGREVTQGYLKTLAARNKDAMAGGGGNEQFHSDINKAVAVLAAKSSAIDVDVTA